MSVRSAVRVAHPRLLDDQSALATGRVVARRGCGSPGGVPQPTKARGGGRRQAPSIRVRAGACARPIRATRRAGRRGSGKAMIALGEASLPASGSGSAPLLRVRDLVVHFPITKGVLFKRSVVTVLSVEGVSFDLHRGETLLVVVDAGGTSITMVRALVTL